MLPATPYLYGYNVRVVAFILIVGNDVRFHKKVMNGKKGTLFIFYFNHHNKKTN